MLSTQSVPVRASVLHHCAICSLPTWRPRVLCFALPARPLQDRHVVVAMASSPPPLTVEGVGGVEGREGPGVGTAPVP